MEANRPYGVTWADQWDYSNPDPIHDDPNNRNGASDKFSGKVADKFHKTKAVTSNGMKKVKEGASVGIHWVKAKYQKTTQNH